MLKVRKLRRRSVPSTGLVLKSVQDYIYLVQMASANGMTAAQLCDKAGVCYGTAAKHLAGDITTPHLRTTIAILKTIGYTVRAQS